MNLKRQLLLISLLTLVLPWAGCQFIRETEIALREGQQQMLSGTAQAIADSLSQFPDELLAKSSDGIYGEEQLYAHPLETEPLIDGYVDDWTIDDESPMALRGQDGRSRFVVGSRGQYLYLHIDVADDLVVFRDDTDGNRSDGVELVVYDEHGDSSSFLFAAEAPGELVARRKLGDEWIDDTRVQGHWRDTPRGYRLEARLPLDLAGQRLGIVVADTDGDRSINSATFSSARPGRLVFPSPLLSSVAGSYTHLGVRLIVTDPDGWRLAQVGAIEKTADDAVAAAGWLRVIYDLLLEPGDDATLADPDPSGREQQPYVNRALAGERDRQWFRSATTGRAVVAVAQPIWSGNVQTGVVVLQQDTDAILSLTNTSLTRLMNFTLIATLGVAACLLGYATWLSSRIRRLSNAAERALDDKQLRTDLPSALAGDEIGDLSRSFSHVLQQLGNYNNYLRTLASKLSHEIRTPLTIVRSSLENLEHEDLPESSTEYTTRARDGVERLQKIINAMSEANRVEELIEHTDPEQFDLYRVLESTTAAYAGAWPDRSFVFDSHADSAIVDGSPELIIQMLDKLADNAVEFSKPGDEITITLDAGSGHAILSVSNPGPPLPERMRSQLFHSMVSVREGDTGKHLGLGLYIARLIAEAHGGSVSADNIEGGVRFTVLLPSASSD